MWKGVEGCGRGIGGRVWWGGVVVSVGGVEECGGWGKVCGGKDGV